MTNRRPNTCGNATVPGIIPYGPWEGVKCLGSFALAPLVNPTVDECWQVRT